MKDLRHLVDLVLSIRSGRTFRETPASLAPDAFRVLSYTDLEGHRLLGRDEARERGVLTSCDPDPSWLADLLQPGDVLFAGKGGRSLAFLFQLPEPTLANSLFVVIRTKPEVLDPGYLVWYLNSSVTQAQLTASMVGTSVPNIPLSALKDLLIPVAPLDRQRLIARVNALAHQEEHLLAELAQQRKALVEQVLTNAIA
jgi:hypothetical protein